MNPGTGKPSTLRIKGLHTGITALDTCACLMHVSVAISRNCEAAAVELHFQSWVKLG
jgi:hypothetical protein